MIAEQMRTIFGYNGWAWARVSRSVEKLDAAAYHAPRPAFLGSIHALLVHAMSAEALWYARANGESPSSLLAPDAFADFAAVRAQWREITHRWSNYVQWLDDEDCRRPIAYRTTTGVPHTLELVDILQHVVNHATEHRSQITPILYELGYPTQPLDYMLYRLGQV